MALRLAPCSSCARPVKQGDATCPFCGEHVSFATRPAARLAVGRLSRSALFAASAATQTGFLSPRGEGSCGFTACGPLLSSAVGALDGDAGAEAGDGGDGLACCFLVVQVCGV